jgi:hypothetical protein
VELKTLGLGTLKESFKNVFRKSWSSTYSTEMFSNWGFEQMEDKGGGGLLTRR